MKSNAQSMKTVVFTGGGTGGHIYPGLAVVDELKEKINSTKIDGKSLDVQIVWIGSSKGMDKNLVEKSGSVDKFIGIPCGKLRRYFSFQNFIDLFKIAAGFISAFFRLAKLKPLVVFSKGGFVSVPSCYAAKLLKIPVFTHECDFSTGLATRLNLKVAEKLLVSYEETKNKLPSSVQEKTIVTGNPVRPIFYTADILGDKAWILQINPLYYYVTYFRSVVIEGVIPSLGFHGIMLGVSVVLFAIGCWMYKKYNYKFLYYV